MRGVFQYTHYTRLHAKSLLDVGIPQSTIMRGVFQYTHYTRLHAKSLLDVGIPQSTIMRGVFQYTHYQKFQAFSPPFCCSISYSPPDPAWLSSYTDYWKMNKWNMK
jgi:hypothetical protein